MSLDLNKYSEVTLCRSCGSTSLEKVLDLGKQPLANSLREPDSLLAEHRFDLILVGCLTCTQLQLSINVNPNLMFNSYFWVTGTSQTAIKHCEMLAHMVLTKIGLSHKSILEIGSNDGTLLKSIEKKSDASIIFGVDPAQNLNVDIDSQNIKVFKNFFDRSFAEKFLQDNPKIDILIARNVLSHVPDLNEVIEAIDLITNLESTIVIEFHHSGIILSELHYDSIYHEHTYYHTLQSVSKLLERFGMFVYDLEYSPISGGSYIIFASKSKKLPSINLKNTQDFETRSLVNNPFAWKKFAVDVQRNIMLNRSIVDKLNKYSACAYGASARSSTLLNSISATAENFLGIADINPLKWGKLSPGVNLKIDDPRNLIEDEIKVVYITAFNFEREIIEYLENVLNWKGTVFVPLPNVPRSFKIGASDSHD